MEQVCAESTRKHGLMPTYEYQCSACDHNFEVFQKNTKSKKKCPECGKMKLEKMISACYGYIAAKQGDMGTVGDLANYNRDHKSKWEKEAADKQYADSSRLGAAKLEREKSGNPEESFYGASKKDMKEIGKLNPEQSKKYILTGQK